MRTFIASIIAVAACSPTVTNNKMDATTKMDGSGSSTKMDSGIFDFGCGGNTACPTSQVCCTHPSNPLSFSCVAPATCSAANQIFCDGPDECGGSTPVCCGVDVPDGTGSYPQCNPASLGTSCTTAAGCPTHIGTSCTDTTKVKLCHVAAECAGDPQNDKCCTFMSGQASLTFCIDATTAQLGGATCHP